MLTAPHEILRKAQLLGILELVCQELELSPTQQATAEERYHAIGKWLSDSRHPLLDSATIYPQGSISLQTTVRPVGQEEFDVDLVCHIPRIAATAHPAELKGLIGHRLRENMRYEPILEEKARCWRINYANEFHLDITPSIPNHECSAGGELVPDKELRCWKPTNPKGYRHWFEARAKLEPAILLYKSEMAGLRAEVETLPAPTKLKGILRRCVQLCKRHRDLFFRTRDPNLAPISIILTTLITKSYETSVSRNSYETDLDFLVDVVRNMPAYVAVERVANRDYYFIWNDTTAGENFAEKWNQNLQLPEAFFFWHLHAVRDFEEMASGGGLDLVNQRLSRSFGEHVVGRAMKSLTDSVGAASRTGLLAVIPGAGLSVGVSRGITVPRNTFFGR